MSVSEITTHRFVVLFLDPTGIWCLVPCGIMFEGSLYGQGFRCVRCFWGRRSMLIRCHEWIVDGFSYLLRARSFCFFGFKGTSI